MKRSGEALLYSMLRDVSDKQCLKRQFLFILQCKNSVLQKVVAISQTRPSVYVNKLHIRFLTYQSTPQHFTIPGPSQRHSKSLMNSLRMSKLAWLWMVLHGFR
jgi:hypothetical protein